MGAFLDKDGVQEIIGRIKELCPQWAKENTKKKREQIIIGKAIRMKSCDVLDAENWYVQQNRVCIRIPKEYQTYRITVLYRSAKDTTYKVGDFEWNAKQKVGILQAKGINKWKVDGYAVGEKSIRIILTYKNCPDTIKGMGTRYEYVNGRRVWNHRFTIDDVQKISVEGFINRYRLYTRKVFYRNQFTRLLSKRERRNMTNLRWQRIRDVKKIKAKSGFRAGLYRAVCIDKRKKCRAYVDFYLTQSGLIKRA